ncbi:MAG: DUF5915 domain-containing protein, partial [Actinobacteria bacterium]|nr:DUF5915 domain-containing protein [Actinomycetota bacterium]
VLDDLSTSGDLVDISLKANFRNLGARFGGKVQAVAKAIAELNPGKLVEQIRSHGSYLLDLEGEEITLTIEDLVITETPREGWTYTSHGGESLALDLTLTPELIAQGHVREVIRFIQDERKEVGLDISDRIKIRWNAKEDLCQAIEESTPFISDEVLALEMIRDKSLALKESELSLTVKLEKVRTS